MFTEFLKMKIIKGMVVVMCMLTNGLLYNFSFLSLKIELFQYLHFLFTLTFR